MTHTYKVTGMTCSGCQATVTRLLSAVDGVNNVAIDLGKGEAKINMNKHVATEVLQQALSHHPKYQLTEEDTYMTPAAKAEDPKQSWLSTYKPILLIFFYITAATLLVQAASGSFHWMDWMHHFMAGFFLTFSFFKLLDLNGFADSYSTYDIIARKWRGWAYLYAFIELGLGFAYLTNTAIIFTTALTFVVMTISIIGVLQAVMNKRRIQCACLGAVFNLPMSTVTIIEDALMIVMSAIMIIHFLL
jgi:copper chaperone CopZ